ncbi:hypothetical protein F4811DRAFT_232756 [Daldinia bambusicola]|nr:hypothetical protein F4811DRAFT_232756 [Daldinia bambusicola]
MARTWEDVFKSYIAPEYKTKNGCELEYSEFRTASKRACNSHIATALLWILRDWAHRKGYVFRDEFYEWTAADWARASPHLRSTIVDFLYYHGVYCEGLGRNNIERLVALGKEDACIEYPTIQESEAATASREASHGLVIRRPARRPARKPA